MSTTEINEQPAGAPGPVDLPENPAPATESSWLGVRWSAWRRWLTRLGPALLYLGIRELGLLVLAWTGGREGTSVTDALTSWDGQWYLGIAGGGYGGVSGRLLDAFGRRTQDTPLAFFPGYPYAVRWVADLPGVGLVAAAFTVSLACGVACAYALARLGRLVGGSAQVGLVLVALFAASPMGIVLSMAYSEAMFCALAAWALVGVLERRWWLAGAATLFAGLVRPTAMALVVTVCAAAIVALVRHRDGWRPWLGLATAPLGLLGYLIFVAVRTGDPTGWFDLQQQGWDSKFDGGVATVRFGLDVLASGRSVLEVGTVGFLLVAIALVVIGVRQRLAWPLVLYGALVLAMDLGSNGLMNSKARMLLPAFTLLLPVAGALVKRRPGTMVITLASIAVASAWFGAYALTGWTYAI
ncbi:MAG TPA: hypothetical protein VH333_18080 [Pseudonocardiaceae bacterium]|nr:hypothetical protein [Pseudonocardiaceae bacterium]